MKLSARIVKTEHCPVILGEEVFDCLGKELGRIRKGHSQIFVLTDRNTLQHCLPILKERCPSLDQATVLTVGPGETVKNLHTAGFLWDQLAGHLAGRRSLLINLGGGMITDLGGFVASCFHRWIPCIHVPTTLIGQTDAAIGSKTGINLGLLKNQLGTYYTPRGVYCWPGFFSTLEFHQLRSGMAEVAKAALVRDERFWHWLSGKPLGELLSIPSSGNHWKELLLRAIRIKLEIVRHDPFELNRRKLLNFGHTIGHAIESLMLGKGTPVLHGEAVAAGMICEIFLSEQVSGLDPAPASGMIRWLADGFGKAGLGLEDIPELLSLMDHDKKNQGREFRFTLLARPGQGKINQPCDREQIAHAITRYLEIPSGTSP